MNRSGQVSFLTLVLVLSILLLPTSGYIFYLRKSLESSFTKSKLLSDEIATFQAKVSQLKQNILSEKNNIQETSEKLSKTSEQHGNLLEETISLKGTIKKLTLNYDHALQEKKSLLENIETITTEKNALTQQIHTMESNSFLADTLKEKAMLEIQVSRLKKTLKKEKLTHKARLSKTTQKHEQIMLEMKEKVSNAENLLVDSDANLKKLEIFKEQIQKQNKLLEESEDRVKDSEQLSKNLAQKIDIKTKKIWKLEKKINKIQSEYNIMLNKLEINKSANKKLELEISKRNYKIKQKDLEIKGLKSKMKDINAQVHLQLKELGQTQESLERMMSQTQKKLLQKHNISPQKSFLESPSSSPNRHFSDVLHKKIPLVQGKVIDIDRSHNFIIIDLGKEDGIEENVRIRILKGKTPIAQAQILEARPEMSAANFNLLGNYVIHKNDTVELVTVS